MGREKEKKELKDFICKTLAEATGTPVDFKERCCILGCDACIFNGLPKALIDADYGHIPTALNAYLHSNVKAAAMIDSIVTIKQREAVKEFAERLKEMLAENSIEDGFDYDYLDYSGTIQTIDELSKEYGDGE